MFQTGWVESAVIAISDRFTVLLSHGHVRNITSRHFQLNSNIAMKVVTNFTEPCRKWYNWYRVCLFISYIKLEADIIIFSIGLKEKNENIKVLHVIYNIMSSSVLGPASCLFPNTWRTQYIMIFINNFFFKIHLITSNWTWNILSKTFYKETTKNDRHLSKAILNRYYKKNIKPK